MDDEIDKRAQLIYDIINNRFCLEWKRISDLDGKANNLIGFVGIILSLYAGLGSFFLKNIRTNEFRPHLIAIFLGGILLLMLSILCGLIAFKIREWKLAPDDTNNFIKEYALDENKSRLVIMGKVTAAVSDTVRIDKEINDRKAGFITKGIIFLGLGLVMVIVFVIVLVLV